MHLTVNARPAGPEALAVLLAKVWHDATCPEGPECRARDLHADSQRRILPLDKLAEAVRAAVYELDATTPTRPPPPPRDRPLLGEAEEPRAMVRRTGTRETGFHAWEAWVDCGLTRFAGEYGTYAWSRKGAERKARWLLRKYHTARSGPRIEVAT